MPKEKSFSPCEARTTSETEQKTGNALVVNGDRRTEQAVEVACSIPSASPLRGTLLIAGTAELPAE